MLRFYFFNALHLLILLHWFLCTLTPVLSLTQLHILSSLCICWNSTAVWKLLNSTGLRWICSLHAQIHSGKISRVYFVFKGYTCNNRFLFSLLACLCKLLEKKLNCIFCCCVVSACKLVFTEKPWWGDQNISLFAQTGISNPNSVLHISLIADKWHFNGNIFWFCFDLGWNSWLMCIWFVASRNYNHWGPSKTEVPDCCTVLRNKKKNTHFVTHWQKHKYFKLWWSIVMENATLGCKGLHKLWEV